MTAEREKRTELKRENSTGNSVDPGGADWVRRFVAGDPPKPLRSRLIERDRLKLERCPTCGAPVATIFDHLEGCPEPAQENAQGTPRNA